MKRFSIAVCALSLAAMACGSAATAPPPAETIEAPPSPAVPGDTFTFAVPGAQGEALTLWGTNYYTPVYTPAPEGAEGAEGALPLLDVNNAPISPPLSRVNWCNVALQGTAMIRTADGSATAYVIADWSGAEQTNCDDRLGNLSDSIKLRSRQSRYKAVLHPYGCGVQDMPLIPFRTIAVDRRQIPYRSVLYIPALRGLSFTLEGQSFTHDGYVFAGDRGGAIVGNHIDFFSGNQQRSPFPDVIASNETKTFEAFRIDAADPAAIALTAMHAAPC
jgi:3D (Asp-Asp-Asp) domain-containing protein